MRATSYPIPPRRRLSRRSSIRPPRSCRRRSRLLLLRTRRRHRLVPSPSVCHRVSRPIRNRLQPSTRPQPRLRSRHTQRHAAMLRVHRNRVAPVRVRRAPSSRSVSRRNWIYSCRNRSKCIGRVRPMIHPSFLRRERKRSWHKSKVMPNNTNERDWRKRRSYSCKHKWNCKLYDYRQFCFITPLIIIHDSHPLF